MQSKSSSNIKGIDVSHHQGNIDWLMAAESGIQFAYIKATEGVGYIDPAFRRNATGAPAVGLKVGFYHYARPETGNSPVQEAESFASAVNGLKSDLPHVLDLEDDKDHKVSALGAAFLTNWAYEWLAEVRKRTGHKVMLYTGGSFARSYCGSKLAEFPLWIAHYGVDTPMANNTWRKWSMFQYASDGKVPGISGKVDMNVMELDFWNELFGEKQRFPDVKADHWARTAIEQADKLGIMNGYQDGSFKPDEPVTRKEMAVISMNIINYVRGMK